jgi:hypothetical protein
MTDSEHSVPLFAASGEWYLVRRVSSTPPSLHSSSQSSVSVTDHYRTRVTASPSSSNHGNDNSSMTRVDARHACRLSLWPHVRYDGRKPKYGWFGTSSNQTNSSVSSSLSYNLTAELVNSSTLTIIDSTLNIRYDAKLNHTNGCLSGAWYVLNHEQQPATPRNGTFIARRLNNGTPPSNASSNVLIRIRHHYGDMSLYVTPLLLALCSILYTLSSTSIIVGVCLVLFVTACLALAYQIGNDYGTRKHNAPRYIPWQPMTPSLVTLATKVVAADNMSGVSIYDAPLLKRLTDKQKQQHLNSLTEQGLPTSPLPPLELPKVVSSSASSWSIDSAQHIDDTYWPVAPRALYHHPLHGGYNGNIRRFHSSMQRLLRMALRRHGGLACHSRRLFDDNSNGQEPAADLDNNLIRNASSLTFDEELIFLHKLYREYGHIEEQSHLWKAPLPAIGMLPSSHPNVSQ